MMDSLGWPNDSLTVTCLTNTSTSTIVSEAWIGFPLSDKYKPVNTKSAESLHFFPLLSREANCKPK